MSRQPGKSKKNDIAYFSEGIESNSIFGRYSAIEMVAQLKELAMDPCRPQFAQDNIQPLSNQIVMLRKVMLLKDSEIPWKRRKLEQFVKDKLNPPADFALPSQQKKPKLSGKQFSSHASSVACLLSSVDSTHVFDYRTSSSLVTFDDTLPEKRSRSFIDDVAVVDSDESVYGSNHPSPDKSSMSNGKRRKHFETPRRSPRLLNFTGDRLQRKVIPVGLRFQAVIPEWNCPENDRSTLIDAYKSNSDTLKWLGSPVWPVENRETKISDRNIGKGRNSCCCCVSPGSADCSGRHIVDERLLMESDLGPAFYIWKFDEMGEQVSEAWSKNEQQTFESLMKKRPSSSNSSKSFWKRVLKSFSNKYKKDIANYYFNVYIPRRMSLHTRSPSLKQIDTDDEDEAEDSKTKYLRTS